MPIYEYICRKCGHAFEILQRMGSGGEELQCPACRAVGADRQLSTFAGRAAAAGGGAGAPSCGPGGFT